MKLYNNKRKAERKTNNDQGHSHKSHFRIIRRFSFSWSAHDVRMLLNQFRCLAVNDIVPTDNSQKPSEDQQCWPQETLAL
jgi:hypothetical protein